MYNQGYCVEEEENIFARTLIWKTCVIINNVVFGAQRSTNEEYVSEGQP